MHKIILRLNMIAEPLTFKRLPMLLATGVLSAGLLLSGCSNSDKNDSAETAMDVENNTDNTAADTQDSEAPDAENTENMLENKGVQITDSLDNKSETAITSDNINPLTAAPQQPSLVTNPTQAGSPEDTVKMALDTLYYGDVETAATYYKVDIPNFTDELAKTQYAFQQTVEGVTITDTKYNSDKTKATITGELMLKEQKRPAPLTYDLQKVNGEWKILG
jgi:outer membrane murein-binding lipoprotein Lpp